MTNWTYPDKNAPVLEGFKLLIGNGYSLLIGNSMNLLIGGIGGDGWSEPSKNSTSYSYTTKN